jgi:pSer/pThr/pTyr-binding forkhead associated (FHA) protein
MPDQIANPYVGPRPFEEEDGHNFFGRNEEIRQLTSLIISHRAVLFYAPSGAGKTSLLRAKVIPNLKERKKLQILPITRVSGDSPPGFDGSNIKNIYVINALVNLAGKQAQPAALAGLSLREGLQPYLERPAADQRLRPKLLILDQFEELFTTYPERYKERADFFLQIQQCLADCPQLSLVLSMREDFIANLDRYAVQMPDRLRTRFRMELLSYECALEAVKMPAENAHRPFEPNVAEQLVDNLRRLQRGRKREKEALTEPVTLGVYVEPVYLQIVCEQLWANLPADRKSIINEDVHKFGDVDQALTGFYRDKLAKVVEKTKVSEYKLRSWFDDYLITPDRTRGMVYRGATKTAGLPNEAVETLYKTCVIRAIPKGNDMWYELAHDRLVEPVLADNASWRQKTLSLLQRQAELWNKSRDKPEHLLLSGAILKEAERWAASHQEQLTESENLFLNSCRQKRARSRYLKWSAAGVLAVLMAFLGYVSFNAYSAWLINRPWGYFGDLSTGQMHLLKDDLASVGRTTEDIKNQVALTNQFISRLHLFIFRNLVAIDMRSRNGTTINAEYLPYGYSKKIENGDLIVLAGVAAFQFSKIVYESLNFATPEKSLPPPPTDSWGILIDSKSKTYTYLDADQYFLAIDAQDKIITEKNESQNTFFVAKVSVNGLNGDRDMTFRFRRLGYHDILYAQKKKDDYEFPVYKITTDKEYELDGSTTFKYRGIPFQIVPIEK